MTVKVTAMTMATKTDCPVEVETAAEEWMDAGAVVVKPVVMVMIMRTAPEGDVGVDEEAVAAVVAVVAGRRLYVGGELLMTAIATTTTTGMTRTKSKSKSKSKSTSRGLR